MLGRSLGRYRIVATLGQGGMSTVWRADDTLLGRTVALKLLADELASSPEAKRRFLREARTGASLTHPGIVTVFDSGEADGHAFIAMACVEGESLTEYAARGPLPIAEVLRIGIAVADALAFAHDKGIVHRDVKSGNVMVGRDGRVFVLDFGLASAQDQSRLTSSGMALGTPSFMSPEVMGGGKADARSDVFGLGVVLYECATGTLPFRGDRREAIGYAVVHGEVEPPRARRPDLPEALESVILRALAKDPDARFADGAAIRDALAGTSGADAVDAGKSVGAPAPAVSQDDRSLPMPVRASAPGEKAELPARIALAVLPFAADHADSSDAGHSRAASGLAATIAAALDRFEGLGVVPLPAEFATREPGDDLRGLARELGANMLLVGSMRHAGGRVRLSYSLVQAHRMQQIAAGTIEGLPVELFELEDRLVAEVAGHLGFTVDGPRTAPQSAPDPAAHERYLQALGYLRRYENEASVDGAVRILEQLVENSPGSAPYQAAYAQACLHKYKLSLQPEWESRAAAACERALALEPDSPEVQTTLAEIHLAVGRNDDAIREFERVLAVRPDSTAALIGLPLALEAQGRWDDALAACRRAIVAQPEYWGHHSKLGVLLYHIGRYEDAIATLQDVVRLAPDNARGYYNMAAACVQLARFDDAVALYRRSIAVQPSARTFNGLGSALFYLSRHDEAIEAYRRGTAFNPSEPLPWGHLGAALHWMGGRDAEANEALDRAIALMRARLERNPSKALDWALLGSWLSDRGFHDEAIRAVERARELAPLDVDSTVNAATVYYQAGRREPALACLREALRQGYSVERLRRSPSLRGLREDPEFATMIAAPPDST